MPAGPTRRFTLLDAMALVAATAVGLGLANEWSRKAARIVIFVGPEEGLVPGLTPWTKWIILSWPVVAAWTVALVALRLRGPRPVGRRLFAPPGVAACLVASIMMALEVADVVAYRVFLMLSYGRPLTMDDNLYTLGYFATRTIPSPSVGMAVAASWGALALAGRWRAEPGWLDRAGRVVGALWIALVFIRLQNGSNVNMSNFF
jgi:hypothetical protein